MQNFSYAAPGVTFDADGSGYEQSCQRLDPVVAHTRLIGLILWLGYADET